MPPSAESNEIPLCDVYIGVRHDDTTAIVDTDRGDTITRLEGHPPESEMLAWLRGWLDGRKSGLQRGRAEGFADCQRQFRTLLGSAEADVADKNRRAIEYLADGEPDIAYFVLRGMNGY